MDSATFYKGRAKKYNHFHETRPTVGHSCQTCIRRQYSYPWTCRDGWKGQRKEQVQRGASCLNWTDDRNAPVD